jgi:hypothetical protein
MLNIQITDVVDRLAQMSLEYPLDSGEARRSIPL